MIEQSSSFHPLIHDSQATPWFGYARVEATTAATVCHVDLDVLCRVDSDLLCHIDPHLICHVNVDSRLLHVPDLCRHTDFQPLCYVNSATSTRTFSATSTSTRNSSTFPISEGTLIRTLNTPHTTSNPCRPFSSCAILLCNLCLIVWAFIGTTVSSRGKIIHIVIPKTSPDWLITGLNRNWLRPVL